MKNMDISDNTFTTVKKGHGGHSETNLSQDKQSH